MSNETSEVEVDIRVRYAECDPMGYLHHAKYFEYLELVRTELLRQSGISYRDLEEKGVFFVVAKLECRYKAPIRYDDVIKACARVERITRTRVDHSYRLFNNGILATEATSTLACVGRDGKPMLMPPGLWPDELTSS